MSLSALWFGTQQYMELNKSKHPGLGMNISQLASDKSDNQSSALDQLIAATSHDMEAVNAKILSRAESHVEIVPEIARYLIDAGGKRLRPMLTLASAHLLGDASGKQINYAAAVEFMHNATLLHDDVVDESDMRRGRPAARKVWGNQASVLVGDFLLGQAFLMMVEAGELDALEVLSKAAAVIAEGEVLQLSKAGDPDTSDAEYMQIISAKTAMLFEAATEVGAMAGGVGSEMRTAMARYGRELGLAFQLVDDALDYGGANGALGKNTGDDLREGKMTLPIILSLGAATASDREVVLSVLGNEQAGDAELAAVRAIIDKHDALQTTLDRAHRHARAAHAALEALPANDLRQLLADVADFCVSRAY